MSGAAFLAATAALAAAAVLALTMMTVETSAANGPQALAVKKPCDSYCAFVIF